MSKKVIPGERLASTNDHNPSTNDHNENSAILHIPCGQILNNDTSVKTEKIRQIQIQKRIQP